MFSDVVASNKGRGKRTLLCKNKKTQVLRSDKKTLPCKIRELATGGDEDKTQGGLCPRKQKTPSGL